MTGQKILVVENNKHISRVVVVHNTAISHDILKQEAQSFLEVG